MWEAVWDAETEHGGGCSTAARGLMMVYIANHETGAVPAKGNSRVSLKCTAIGAAQHE